MISRRRFLKQTSLVSLVPFVPGMLARAAEAAKENSNGRVLVVIQLDGGNDGLNTVVPYTDANYGRHRRQLRLNAKDLHKLNESVALHPSMEGARKLFDEGQLAIVQGVGYPNPDRSHFRSMRIWQTARFDDQEHNSYGWLGRALDQELVRQVPTDGSDAVYVGDQQTPVALWGRRAVALGLSRADDLKLNLAIASAPPNPASTKDESLDDFVTRQVLSTYFAADQFNSRRSASTANGNYPDTELGSRLRLVSEILKSGSCTRVFYTAQTGYDTHSAQLETHADLLRDLSNSLKAFLDDLKTANLHEQVVVLAFSEFGRRVAENNSLGTDHGAAAPVFLAGAPVRGGIIGTPPDLEDLDNGDLKSQFDFRRIYATLLDSWLGASARDVLGDSFDTLPLLKT